MIWPGRRRPRPTTGRGRRAPKPLRVERVGLADLRPDPAAFLGQAAYLQLAMFETATAIAGRASDLADRETLTRVASAILAKHHRLVDLLAARGLDSTTAMRPYTDDVERYRRRLGDTPWTESVLTLHLATALLDDFFARLAEGLPEPEGAAVGDVLLADPGHDALAALLQGALAADARLASRLSLWGRRLVGDTLLVARAALDTARTADGGPTETDEVRIEPVLSELLAGHSRRMDALGLTA